MDSRFREHSRVLIDGFSRAPARSYFKAIGLSDADLAKPSVGIANTWIETMPSTPSRSATVRRWEPKE